MNGDEMITMYITKITRLYIYARFIKNAAASIYKNKLISIHEWLGFIVGGLAS